MQTQTKTHAHRHGFNPAGFLDHVSARAMPRVRAAIILAATALVALASLVTSQLGAIAQGVTDDTILIGNSSPLTGPIAPSNKEALDGAKMYFDLINKQGGVNGRKIVFEVVDDAQDAKRGAENTRALIEEKRVLALLMYRTTPAIEAALPLAEKARVPFLFPQVGPAAVYDPKYRMSYSIRAPYSVEAELAVTQSVRLGTRRIAVVAADDGFGRDSLSGAEAGMAESKISSVATIRVDNKSFDPAKTVAALKAANPQAVLVFTNATLAANLIKAARQEKLPIQFITLSNNSSQSFVDSLGEAGRGTVITQVFPSPTVSGAAIEFEKIVAATPGARQSYAALQGYLSARVLVEAIRKAGKNLSRESLMSALSATRLSFFDYSIDFSSTDRHGSDFVDLTIIDKHGRLRL
jgi:branched-chain amino acid transport system substrate-binding protein